MSILNQINDNLIQSRKNKDSDKISFWSTVLANVKLIEKSDNKKDLTDENVVNVVKKLIKEETETKAGAELAKKVDMADICMQRISALEALIPEKFKPVAHELLESTIRKIVDSLTDEQKKKAMGFIMPKLKEEFGTRLDGKVANQLVKEILSKK